MYVKRKKISTNAIDNYLSFICNDLLKTNPHVSFAISKKFILKNGIFEDLEVSGDKVLVVSKPINELIISGDYVITKKDGECYISHFLRNDIKIKLIYSSINVSKTMIKNKETTVLNMNFLDDSNKEKLLIKK